MIDISNTGERIFLEKETPMMIARHFCAYKFVKDYVGNKTVLDIGCGEGYGSFYLADFAKGVVGIDYDNSVINYAKNKYQKNNLKFYMLDIRDLNTLNNKFDTICSFQVIEHIQNTKFFLADIKDLLNDNGIFICSTPNKFDASPNSDTPLNKFHVKEYTLGEFRELLESFFTKVDIFGLKRAGKLNFYRRLKKVGLLNFLPASFNPVNRFYSRITCDNFVIARDKIEMTLDFIAICRW